MPSPVKFIIIFSVLICSISLSRSDLLGGFCGTNGNYTSNSVYEKNLDSAFANLYSAANTSNSGFYNASVGEGSDRVHAFVLCRGDVQPDICRSCVKDSTNMLRKLCPNQKEAFEWYQECMLRYSNNSILNKVVTQPTGRLRARNAENMVQFNQDLRDLLDDLKAKAIQSKFATGQRRGPNFQTIFGLMQCTPDLSSMQCSDCLENAIRYIATCCSGRIGGQILKPSCRLRFEVGPFYNETTAIDAPAPRSQLPQPIARKDDNNNRTVIIIVVVIVGFLILLLVLVCIIKRKKNQMTATGRLVDDNMEDMNSTESLQYEFGSIEVATNHFSDSNKLGEGGFGAVYKGTLQNGEEIAVKRLSTGSNQGQLEFKNEVILVAKLQHRNLVRLLGFCFEGTERLLIYEFVPNASLDHFIFDSGRRSYMDWEKRYKIIGGVARGLLYLHEDSRLRIIHRDLKASNVLLDTEMNPKIADFGMARLFNMDESQGMTSKIVGTYGYMAPEYAMYGQFSVKSDVFSFGVLVLEMVSGQKNHSFQNGKNLEDLASFAWKNWREGTAINIIDPILRNNSASIREMMRCIHIGLLCVQENVTNRPTMASVMLMLNSFSLNLEVPSEPAFFTPSNIDSGLSLSTDDSTSRVSDKSSDYSVDKDPITDLHPR